MNRESLVDKIRALLAKTTANGCTEAEMLTALAKARAMRDAYAVTDEELQIAKDEAAVLRDEPDDPNDPHNIKWRLCSAVADFCDCQVWAAPRSRYRSLVFCGMAGDTQFASWLLDHLTDFVSVELVKHLMTSLAPSSERSRVIKDFLTGITERISERMRELCKPPAGQADNSRALVAIKSSAIADKMKDCGIKVRIISSCFSINSEADYEAGRKAGNGASFGRPVSGAVGVLRLT
jgi:Protein of unknown function (DUF2786)